MSSRRWAELQKQCEDEIKDHALSEITSHRLDVPESGVRAFYLKRPKGDRMMSTLLIFSPEGITICGDYCPRPRDSYGVQSTFGYGLSWFSGHLGGDYLCEKFLREEWQAEVAASWCTEHAEEIEAEKSEKDEQGRLFDGIAEDEWKAKQKRRAEAFRDLAKELNDGNVPNVEDFVDRVTNFYPSFETSDGVGYTEPLWDAAVLCAIQKKFAEEYAVMKKKLGVTERA